MATTIVGTIELIAKIDTKQYEKSASDIESTNQKIANSATETEKKSNKAFSNIAKIGIGALISAAVAAGVAITKNIGNAVNRVDTLVAFPRVLQALGSSTEDAESSTRRLSESLRGLPTSLQAGAAGVQGLVTAGLDINKATEAFLGLNNALLVSGAGTAQVESSMLQLQQALSRGRIEGQEWNTIAANMPTVLQALSRETGKTKDELREMFREDPQALLDNIIRLNKEGGGGLASLDAQAREATGGIGTAFENMNNAITRGIEGIVRSIGEGGTDQEKLASGQRKISDAITGVGNAFGRALASFGIFVSFLERNKDVVIPIAVAIGTFTAAITTAYVALKAIAVAQKAFNLVFAANPIGLVITLVASLVAGLIYFFTQTEIGKEILRRFFEFTVNSFNKIKDVAQGVWDWIKGAFSKIGEIGTSIIKGAVNTVLGVAERTINGFIKLINLVIRGLNKLPGVNIGLIGSLSIPRLAEGGIISSPTLAMVGEGREPEAVIPLSKLDRMINSNGNGNGATINQTNNFYNSDEPNMEKVNSDLLWEYSKI